MRPDSSELFDICTLKVRPRSGFSVLEMLIVIAIIAITASIATPVLVGTMRHSRVQYAAEELISRFGSARSYAISNNTYSRMIFDEGSSGYQIQLYDSQSGEWVDLGDKQTLAYKVKFKDGGISFPDFLAQFDPFGSLKDGGSVEISDEFGNNVKLVAIVSNGQLNKSE